MTADEIRKKFLDFFASKGHTIVPSDSVVPKEDQTVLFTTAGMQQFKRQFLGYVGDYTRAASSQKCLRTDDLDKVGQTDFHHTFFEMLGNFSFGDYFKKEAIAWAWEFLTKELKIPADNLWVSVYTDDDEAAQIWLKDIKIDPKKLVRLGDKSNFWPAEAREKGPNGPCGPCSEIFYDYGSNPKCTSKKCDPACDCGRFSEIWNLVFTQFDRKEGGVLDPLPNKNIDTGMGLERLVAVVQGKKSNYETDLFAPIIAAIGSETSKNGYEIPLQDKRIIADHIRAIVFGISDGVIPSNEGRGYVIKKLIVDATDKMIPLGKQRTRLWELVSTVVELMKEPYQELLNKGKAENIRQNIQRIQESYLMTRKEKIPEIIAKISDILNKETSRDQKTEELGELCFFYRDTHGLTNSSIVKAINDAMASDSKFALDVNFLIAGTTREQIIAKMNEQIMVVMNKHMDRQRKKSRASSKMTGDVFTGAELDVDIPKTKFEGYEHTQSTGKIVRLFIDDTNVKEVSKGDQVKVVLDKTPFYAEAGGQVGDTGYISGTKGKIRVEDTQKINDVYVHRGVVEEGLLRVDGTVETKIDVERRLSIMRHHTATHLLQAALREVFGTHVQQQGSLVAEDRLRFDFTHHKALTNGELEKIETRVNAYILQCDQVGKEHMPIQKARESGALAFFAEKYGETVRVVSIGNYSREFCGGTHLDSTGQIGLFKITGETAVAQGIRRLEAKAGMEALRFVHEEERKLGEVARMFKSSPSELIDRADAQTKRLKQLEKDLEKYQLETMKASIDGMIRTAEVRNGSLIISSCFQGIEGGVLRQLSDLIKQKAKSSVIVLGSQSGENATILLAVTDDLIQRGVKADEMIKEIAPLIGGSGGGRPQLAQAGSKQAHQVDQAIRRAAEFIGERIKK